MRLFLILLMIVGASVLVGTLLPIVLTRLSYRLVPWSIGAALTRAFVWVCAWAMLVTFRVVYFASQHVPAPLDMRLLELSDRLTPLRWCSLSTALHEVCEPCADAAPGFWDWRVDCAGHDCRTCDTCTYWPEHSGKHLTA